MSSKTAFCAIQKVNNNRTLAGFLPPQGIACAVVKGADAEAVEPLLVDFERAADQQLGRKFLDGIFDRLGGMLKRV